MYTELEQQTLDIDWFFTDKSKIGFIASAGGKLPESISKLGEGNQLLSSYFRNLPEISEIFINTELDSKLRNDENYLSDFISMAKRGLYTFDKTKLNDFLNSNYHLVAYPIKSLELRNIPQNILDILSKTYYKNIDRTKKIDVKEIK